MRISRARRNMYRSARLLGDLPAIEQRPKTLKKRIIRRVVGRYVSRRLWRGLKSQIHT